MPGEWWFILNSLNEYKTGIYEVLINTIGFTPQIPRGGPDSACKSKARDPNCPQTQMPTIKTLQICYVIIRK